MPYFHDLPSDPIAIDYSIWSTRTATVREPFASLFRVHDVRRYEMVAHLLNALRLGGDPLTDENAAYLVYEVYRLVIEAWECGVRGDDRDRAKAVASLAIGRFSQDDFTELLYEIEWHSTLVVNHATLANFDRRLREACVARLTTPIHKMLRKAKAAASVQAAS